MFIGTDDRTQIFSVQFGPAGGPALLAIGGWIGSWELWASPFGLLSQRWRTIGYDHRGAGATSAPLESITFENLVKDVFRVMDAWGVERCVLGAESAGALTALAAALHSPERISGLVLVDGLYFPGPISPKAPFLLGLQNQYAATIERFIQTCVPEPDSEAIKNWGRQILQRAAPEAAIALYQMTGGVDLVAALPRITQPTLLIHGEADVVAPLSAAEKLAALLPAAKLVTLPGAGHVPTMTRTDLVVEAINTFFAGNSD